MNGRERTDLLADDIAAFFRRHGIGMEHSVKSENYHLQVFPGATEEETERLMSSTTLEIHPDHIYFLQRVGNGIKFRGGSLADIATTIKYSKSFSQGIFDLTDSWNPSLEMPEPNDSAELLGEEVYARKLANSEYYFSNSHLYGSMVVQDIGCGYYRHLILNGDQRGFLWEDLRAADCGIVPTEHLGRQLSFIDFYDLEIRTTLRGLERELD